MRTTSVKASPETLLAYPSLSKGREACAKGLTTSLWYEYRPCSALHLHIPHEKCWEIRGSPAPPPAAPQISTSPRDEELMCHSRSGPAQKVSLALASSDPSFIGPSPAHKPGPGVLLQPPCACDPWQDCTLSRLDLRAGCQPCIIPSIRSALPCWVFGMPEGTREF